MLLKLLKCSSFIISLLVFVNIFIPVSFLYADDDFILNDHTQNDPLFKYEDKQYSNVSINENFIGDSLLVVLDKNISEINKVHDDTLFGTFPKKEIIDLTRVVEDKDIDQSLINWGEFRQIYSIVLPEDNKELVILAIKELEKIEGIMYVGPNFIESPDISTIPIYTDIYSDLESDYTDDEIILNDYTQNDPLIKYEDKQYSNVSIDENFAGDRVLVLLDKNISGINKVHDDALFGTFPKKEIRELTVYDKNKDQLLMNQEEFRQIFSIVLPEDNKELVILAIKELETIEGIYYAGPNFIQLPDLDSPDLSSIPVYTNIFLDLESDYWAYEYISFLYEQGIIDGYRQPDSTFTYCPEKDISRVEFVKLLVKLLKLPLNFNYQESYFTDWDKIDNWAKPYVGALLESDIPIGSNKDFISLLGSGESLSRLEMVTIVFQMPGFLSDNVDINDDIFVYAIENEMINISNYGAEPLVNAKRSEAAMLLYKYYIQFMI